AEDTNLGRQAAIKVLPDLFSGDPERLVIGRKTLNGRVAGPVSRLDYYSFREHCGSFEITAAIAPYPQQNAITGRAEPELADVVFVTWNLFPTLRVSPVLGRNFRPEEETADDPRVVMISYGYRQRRFGGSHEAIGSALNLNGRSHTVVGVMPRGFRFLVDADMWRLVTTTGPWDPTRDSHSHLLIARLCPGSRSGRHSMRPTGWRRA
ncbi:MAG: hypothetical protein FJW35_13760, partial [Acidobacteria bacterium]|nr:hypothetical protein [Acidobacteriota bacterium]